MRHRRDENDRRVRREPRAGFPDQPVDFFQADGLKARRQFSTQLLERVAARVRGTPLTKFALLANHTERQEDDAGARNQDGSEQKTDPACPPTAIWRVHRRILGPRPRWVLS